MPTLELDREQILTEIDRVARLRVGISGREVLRRYSAGTLEEPGEVGDLLVLADLLDPEDEVFSA